MADELWCTRSPISTNFGSIPWCLLSVLLATVKGKLHDEGWGSKFGCPGIKVDVKGQVVHGYIFRSDKLEENISFFDEFEGTEYKRTITDITLKNGITTKAYIYQLI